jgi:hypothetical protein
VAIPPEPIALQSSLFTFKRPSLCFQTDEAYPPALTRNTQGRPGNAQMSAIARGSHQGQARCRRGAGQDRRRLNYETQASDKTSACCNTKSTARASWSGGYLYFRKMRLTINRSFARTVSRTDQSTETFFRKFSANSTAIFFNICMFAVNKCDKGKKARSQRQTILNSYAVKALNSQSKG